MLFLCTEIQIYRFENKGQAYNAPIFSTFCKFQLETYFLVIVQRNDFHFRLNYDVRFTVVKTGFLKRFNSLCLIVLIVYIDMPKDKYA